jgi:hypothetical protein
MIREVLNSKGTKAITSDCWHVVHSHFTVVKRGPAFKRGIHSEHGDRAACAKVARKLQAELALENANVPPEQRDEVFVCKPGYKSLKMARRRSAATSE